MLTRFGKAFPGEILGISSSDNDGWLRGLNLSVKSRNGMLICVKVLFSFARSQNCLPAEQMTAAEQVNKVKIKNDDDVSVFSPEQMSKILHAAPPHLIPILAIAAFSGIRMAELNRLDWSAIDLERSIIELRADQAKTASRRLIPITDNLRAWIEPLPRKGKVVRTELLHREVIREFQSMMSSMAIGSDAVVGEIARAMADADGSLSRWLQGGRAVSDCEDADTRRPSPNTSPKPTKNLPTVSTPLNP